MSDKLIFSIFPNDNFIDLRIYQCGFEKCAVGHLFGPAVRNNYLFHYVIRGKGTLMANDTKGITQNYEITAGQGFMLFPGQMTTYFASQDDPWEYMWIEFGGLRAKEGLVNTPLNVNACQYRCIYPEIRDVMVSEMRYIVDHSKESSLSLIGHLYLFFDALIRSCSITKVNNHKKMSDYYIKEAIHYIEQNYEGDVSVETIADILGINRTYFGKIFRKSTGKTPQQFIIEYRMTKASVLLKTTRLTISEISQMVGYENPFHFSRAFKQIYSISPKQWRQQNQTPSSSLLMEEETGTTPPFTSLESKQQ